VVPVLRVHPPFTGEISMSKTRPNKKKFERIVFPLILDYNAEICRNTEGHLNRVESFFFTLVTQDRYPILT
jgi:hypothetical protein